MGKLARSPPAIVRQVDARVQLGVRGATRCSIECYRQPEVYVNKLQAKTVEVLRCIQMMGWGPTFFRQQPYGHTPPPPLHGTASLFISRRFTSSFLLATSSVRYALAPWPNESRSKIIKTNPISKGLDTFQTVRVELNEVEG